MGPNITPGRLRPAPGQRPRLGVGRSPRCGVRGCHPGKFLKTQILNPAFWWLLRSLVGSRGRVYSSKQACQGLNTHTHVRLLDERLTDRNLNNDTARPNVGLSFKMQL